MKKRDETSQAISWMSNYFHCFTDKQPMADRTVIWHLNPKDTKKGIYCKYKEWCTETPNALSPVSDSYFNTLWDKNFPHVKIPENKRFKQCT